MQKTTRLLLVIFMVAVLAVGCGPKDEKTSNTETDKEKIEQLDFSQTVSTTTVEQNDEVDSEENTEPEKTIYNPLTGEMVAKTQNLTAVMVNNHGQARPQTGLIDADIVYEMEMEGLITRFFALFYGDPPKHVGPVRSARPYALELAKEWDSYFVHVGGSDEAFALIEKWGIRDIDDTKGHPGFWLDKSRKRPHNTYINLERALQGKKENGKLERWEFVDKYESIPDYTEITFQYSQYNRVKYLWDDAEEVYKRYINDSKHIDRISAEQIKVKNLIFQYAPHKYTGDEDKHIEIALIGTGKAEYLLGGKYFTGTWEKKNLSSPTQFFDDKGNPIKLVKGNTWIQVVRGNADIEKTE